MFDGKHIFIVVDIPQPSWLLIIGQAFDKDFVATEIIGWSVEADDKVLWKQVFRQHFIVLIRVDEDIRERSCGVADIATPVKSVQKLADQPIGGCDFLLVVLGIDRSVVSLVINEQHRLINHLTVTASTIVLEPLQQVAECIRLLLDHENDRNLVGINLARVG